MSMYRKAAKSVVLSGVCAVKIASAQDAVSADEALDTQKLDGQANANVVAATETDAGVRVDGQTEQAKPQAPVEAKIIQTPAQYTVPAANQSVDSVKMGYGRGAMISQTVQKIMVHG